MTDEAHGPWPERIWLQDCTGSWTWSTHLACGCDRQCQSQEYVRADALDAAHKRIAELEKAARVVIEGQGKCDTHGEEDTGWCKAHERSVMQCALYGNLALLLPEYRGDWTCQRCGSTISSPHCPCELEPPE